jgi:hypothetical protein
LLTSLPCVLSCRQGEQANSGAATRPEAGAGKTPLVTGQLAPVIASPSTTDNDTRIAHGPPASARARACRGQTTSSGGKQIARGQMRKRAEFFVLYTRPGPSRGGGPHTGRD